MGSTSQVSTLRTQSPPSLEISSFFHADPLDLHSLELGSQQNSMVPNSQPIAARPPPNSRLKLKDLHSNPVINLTTMRICRDPGPDTEDMPIINRAGPTSDLKSTPILPEGAEAGYLELYFTHFHHRWPIIHRPVYHSETHKELFKLTMLTIGAWLAGTVMDKEYALAMHDYLGCHISSELVRTSS